MTTYVDKIDGVRAMELLASGHRLRLEIIDPNGGESVLQATFDPDRNGVSVTTEFTNLPPDDMVLFFGDASAALVGLLALAVDGRVTIGGHGRLQ